MQNQHGLILLLEKNLSCFQLLGVRRAFRTGPCEDGIGVFRSLDGLCNHTIGRFELAGKDLHMTAYLSNIIRV